MILRLEPAPAPPQRDPTAYDLLEMRQTMSDFVYYASRCESDRDFCLDLAEHVRRRIERITGAPEPMPQMEPRYVGVHLHFNGWMWEYLSNDGRTRVRRQGFATARDAAVAREHWFDSHGTVGVLRNAV